MRGAAATAEEGLREFRQDDAFAVTAIEKCDLPPEHHLAAGDLLRDSRPPHDRVTLRLVAGTPAIGFMEVVDYPAIPRDRVRCALRLVVAPEYRRRGVGTTLLERALAFASERGARALQARFLQREEDGPGSAFLRRHGFSEVTGERRVTLHLDVKAFDAVRHSDSIRRVHDAGVRVVACEVLADTAEHRRRLYGLLRATELLGRRTDFESWSASPARWEWARRALLVADAGGEWVGLTQVAPHNAASGVWRTAHAATVPRWRNRGIATALKVASIELLRRRGCRVMLTANRLDNGPMLAINRKLGYVPGPLELTYTNAPTRGHQRIRLR